MIHLWDIMDQLKQIASMAEIQTKTASSWIFFLHCTRTHTHGFFDTPQTSRQCGVLIKKITFYLRVLSNPLICCASSNWTARCSWFTDLYIFKISIHILSGLWGSVGFFFLHHSHITSPVSAWTVVLLNWTTGLLPTQHPYWSVSMSLTWQEVWFKQHTNVIEDHFGTVIDPKGEIHPFRGCVVEGQNQPASHLTLLQLWDRGFCLNSTNCVYIRAVQINNKPLKCVHLHYW